MYDNIICGRASLHFKLICSGTCSCIWKEDIAFLYIMQHLVTSGTSKHTCMHMHVQYLHVHTRGVPARVAQSVECPLRKPNVTGSIPGRDIPKSLKMVLAAPRLAIRLTGKS